MCFFVLLVGVASTRGHAARISVETGLVSRNSVWDATPSGTQISLNDADMADIMRAIEIERPDMYRMIINQDMRANVSSCQTKKHTQEQAMYDASQCKLPEACSGHVDDDIKDLICRAHAVPYNFPSKNNRIEQYVCHSASRQEEVSEFAKATRPIIHPRVLEFMESYLKHKQQHGSKFEMDIYQDMGVYDLAVRLLRKRPLAFLGKEDLYLLRDGLTQGYAVGDVCDTFDNIGTENESSMLNFADYISYEEMELAALLGVSTPTHFINNGGRRNRCVPGRTTEPKGILVGLVGCRFERKNKMEWRHMMVSRSQNTRSKGYGKHPYKLNPVLDEWAKFYGIKHFPSYREVVAKSKKSNNHYIKLAHRDIYLNVDVYRARCEITAEMFLAEANERASAAKSMAFCNVIGLGLGAWKVHRMQKNIQAQAYLTVALGMNLSHVGLIFFSYFGECPLRGSLCKKGRVQSKDGSKIKIIFGKRNPSDPTSITAGAGDSPWLLISQYAWDGNSYPGNEYWIGQLDASGDPATACSSFIPELQNPDVNVNAFTSDRIHVVPALVSSSPLTNRSSNYIEKRQYSWAEASAMETQARRRRRDSSKAISSKPSDKALGVDAVKNALGHIHSTTVVPASNATESDTRRRRRGSSRPASSSKPSDETTDADAATTLPGYTLSTTVVPVSNAIETNRRRRRRRRKRRSSRLISSSKPSDKSTDVNDPKNAPGNALSTTIVPAINANGTNRRRRSSESISPSQPPADATNIDATKALPGYTFSTTVEPMSKATDTNRRRRRRRRGRSVATRFYAWLRGRWATVSASKITSTRGGTKNATGEALSTNAVPVVNAYEANTTRRRRDPSVPSSTGRRSDEVTVSSGANKTLEDTSLNIVVPGGTSATTVMPAVRRRRPSVPSSTADGVKEASEYVSTTAITPVKDGKS